MQRMIFLLVLVALAMTFGVAPASADNGMLYQHFYNWMRDDDGDGIPNHLDDDWTPPEDGEGYQVKHGFNHLFGFNGDTDEGSMIQNHYRKRIEDANASGAFIRLLKRLRDGSCE